MLKQIVSQAFIIKQDTFLFFMIQFLTTFLLIILSFQSLKYHFL